MVRLYRTFSNYISSGDTRCAGCNMHRFREVQAHRTSSNLLELHPHRDSKVYRLLSHEFGVVRLYRTFSNYISSGDTRCAGCNMHWFGEACFPLHHSGSRRFGVVEPPRTHSKLPCRPASSSRFEEVRCGRTTPNSLELTCRPASPCITVVRGGSVWSNLPKLTRN